MNERSVVLIVPVRRRPPIRRRLPVLLAATTVLAFVSCSTWSTGGRQAGNGGATPVPAPSPSGQLALPPRPPVFYVDPDSPAAKQVRKWTAAGRLNDAALLRKISEQPTALWLTDETTSVRGLVATYSARARILGQLPIFVADNIPHIKCGTFDPSGGSASPDAYRRWIRDFAAGLGGRDAIVILEPNAIPDAIGGCVANATQRYALLRDAVTVLEDSGPVRVYLVVGQPTWISDVQVVARALTLAGVDRADGFALNVGSFVSTSDNIRYGLRISDALGGRPHFVIDTSRNGNGLYPYDTVNGIPGWCNPPGRALGDPPTDHTGWARLDALLWIKYPGESDGACRPGEPASGVWWPEYALDLVKGSL